MAEEKIKKDEVMSDAELDNVVGGGLRQLVGDKDFLAWLGLPHYNGTMVLDTSIGKCEDQNNEGWAKIGITSNTQEWFGDVRDNIYTLNGKSCTRKEAFAHALKVMKGYSDAQIRNYDYDQWAGSF